MVNRQKKHRDPKITVWLLSMPVYTENINYQEGQMKE